MKKTIILALFTILMFIFGGIALFTLDRNTIADVRGQVMHGDWAPPFNVDRFDAEVRTGGQWYEKSEPLQGLDQIKVNLVNATVNLVTEARDDVHIEYSEWPDHEGKRLTIEKSGKTLQIRENAQNFMSFGERDLELTVRIPEKFAGDLFVDHVNGIITGEGLRNNLKVDTVNSDISLHFTQNAGVKIDNVNGSTELQLANKENVDVKLDMVNGDIVVGGEMVTNNAMGIGNSFKQVFGSGDKKIQVDQVNGSITVYFGDDFPIIAD